jgi:hypothetical protein
VGQGPQPLVVLQPGLGQRDRPPERRLGRVEVLARQRDEALPGDAVRLPADVALGLGQPERLVPARTAGREVALGEGHRRVGEQRADAGGGRQRTRERPLGEAPTDQQVATQPPVEPQRPAHAAGELAVVEGEARLERRLEVALLPGGRGERVDRVGPPVGRHLLLGEGEEEPGVPQPRCPLLDLVVAEAGAGVLQHRLELVVARAVGGDADQRVLDEALERREHVPFGDGLRGLEREAAGEHAQQPEQPPLVGLEQVVAPVEGRLHGALARRQVAGPRAGHRRVEAGQQGGRVQQAHLGRGQLEGQRDAGEPAAQPRDVQGVAVVDREAGRDRDGALGEQRARG